VRKSLGSQDTALPDTVLVIGSYDADGRPNVMTAACGGIACSRPPASACHCGPPPVARQHRLSEGVYHQPAEPRASRRGRLFGLVSGRNATSSPPPD